MYVSLRSLLNARKQLKRAWLKPSAGAIAHLALDERLCRGLYLLVYIIRGEDEVNNECQGEGERVPSIVHCTVQCSGIVQ